MNLFICIQKLAPLDLTEGFPKRIILGSVHGQEKRTRHQRSHKTSAVAKGAIWTVLVSCSFWIGWATQATCWYCCTCVEQWFLDVLLWFHPLEKFRKRSWQCWHWQSQPLPKSFSLTLRKKSMCLMQAQVGMAAGEQDILFQRYPAGPGLLCRAEVHRVYWPWSWMNCDVCGCHWWFAHGPCQWHWCFLQGTIEKWLAGSTSWEPGVMQSVDSCKIHRVTESAHAEAAKSVIDPGKCQQARSSDFSCNAVS